MKWYKINSDITMEQLVDAEKKADGVVKNVLNKYGEPFQAESLSSIYISTSKGDLIPRRFTTEISMRTLYFDYRKTAQYGYDRHSEDLMMLHGKKVKEEDIKQGGIVFNSIMFDEDLFSEEEPEPLKIKGGYIY